MKYVRIRSFSGLYFPAFGLNTERYSVSLRIQSECRKIRTTKTPNTDTFYAVNMKNILTKAKSFYIKKTWIITMAKQQKKSFRNGKEFMESQNLTSLFWNHSWQINSPHILTENDTKQGILLGIKMSFCYICNWST